LAAFTRETVRGREVKNKQALASPQALDDDRGLEALRK